jgi:hypothetical protein
VEPDDDQRGGEDEARDSLIANLGCSRTFGEEHRRPAESRCQNQKARRVLVALPGQTFVFPLEQLRARAGFVRTGAAPAHTMVLALTSRALLAKRQFKATLLCVPPVCDGWVFGSDKPNAKERRSRHARDGHDPFFGVEKSDS